jgi:hypothetical protein
MSCQPSGGFLAMCSKTNDGSERALNMVAQQCVDSKVAMAQEWLHNGRV